MNSDQFLNGSWVAYRKVVSTWQLYSSYDELYLIYDVYHKTNTAWTRRNASSAGPVLDLATKPRTVLYALRLR